MAAVITDPALRNALQQALGAADQAEPDTKAEAALAALRSLGFDVEAREALPVEIAVAAVVSALVPASLVPDALKFAAAAIEGLKVQGYEITPITGGS